MIGVLALQGDVREHLAALSACGLRAVPVRRPAELDAVDALVIPGGESTTMSRLLETFELLDPLRGRHRGGHAGLRLVCRDDPAGVRGAGRAAGPAASSAGWTWWCGATPSGGRSTRSRRTCRFDGVPGAPVRAVFIRAPWVESAGPGVQVLATVPPVTLTGASAGRAAGRAVAVRQGAVLATSFHPELTGDGRVHALFCSMVRELTAAA